MVRKNKNLLLPLLCLLVGNLMLFAVFCCRIHHERKGAFTQALHDAERNGQRVQMLFENASNMTEMFGKEIRAIENNNILDKEIAGILSDYYGIYQNTISSIQYAPDGYIRYIYPEVDNDRWSINLFETADLGADAAYSRDTGEELISGPMELMQGGEGIVISYPVYREEGQVGREGFLGFVSVIVDLHHIIDDPNVMSLNEDNYRYLLVKEGHQQDAAMRQPVLVGKAGLEIGDDLSDTASYAFDLSGYRFVLYIIPQSGWINYMQNGAAFTLFEIIILLFAALVYALFSIRDKTELLKELSETDHLTGLKNRTALRERFPEMVGSKITVAMTDIDYFKKYNDTYGHEMGDTVLRRIAEILRRYQSETFEVYRFGGDEFLIWDTSGSEEKAIARIQEMMAEIDQIVIRGCDFPIHMTFGACFGNPKTDEELRNLRYIADERLYEKKQSRPKQ